VERVRTAEDKAVPGSTALTDAVARSLFKLMSYKDEYEVARLYTNGHFEKQVASAFEGDNLTYEFHLAPPLFARKDPVTGVPRKMSFGPWMMKAFRVLAGLKPLRGTPLDVFGYTHERRTERGLIREFEGRIEEIVARLNADNHPTAVGLAGIPQKITSRIET
jgi:indolepyruvate ferredoxin oxidoreductase